MPEDGVMPPRQICPRCKKKITEFRPFYANSGTCFSCAPARTFEVKKSVAKTEFSTQHMYTVCKLGQGSAVCAFLQLSASNGLMCLKGTEYEGNLRARLVEEKFAPGQLKATRDNCSGPPDYKSFS